MSYTRCESIIFYQQYLDKVNFFFGSMAESLKDSLSFKNMFDSFTQNRYFLCMNSTILKTGGWSMLCEMKLETS